MSRKHTTIRLCPSCEQPFRPADTEIRRGHGRFCSIACRARAQAIPLERRFWSKVDRSGDCWLWLAGKNPGGYGRVRYEAKATLAHQVAWMLASGTSIPAGLFVCHTCDLRSCCRNDGGLDTYIVEDIAYPRYGHLWLGTNAANMADMVTKGRQTLGERDGSSKLTESDVRSIRTDYATGNFTQATLGVRYGVGGTAICLIVNKKR